MSGNEKECPGAVDYQEFSMWKYDDESDLYYPVLSPKDLPDGESDLTIYSRFTLPNGKQFEGYIVGVERVFSMGMFAGGCVFCININMPDVSIEQIEDFLKIQRGLEVENPLDIFPLRYRTLIKLEGFSNIEGVFNFD